MDEAIFCPSAALLCLACHNKAAAEYAAAGKATWMRPFPRVERPNGERTFNVHCDRCEAVCWTSREDVAACASWVRFANADRYGPDMWQLTQTGGMYVGAELRTTTPDLRSVVVAAFWDEDAEGIATEDAVVAFVYDASEYDSACPEPLAELVPNDRTELLRRVNIYLGEELCEICHADAIDMQAGHALCIDCFNAWDADRERSRGPEAEFDRIRANRGDY